MLKSYTGFCELNFWPRIVQTKSMQKYFFISETKEEKKKKAFANHAYSLAYFFVMGRFSLPRIIKFVNEER